MRDWKRKDKKGGLKEKGMKRISGKEEWARTKSRKIDEIKMLRKRKNEKGN